MKSFLFYGYCVFSALLVCIGMSAQTVVVDGVVYSLDSTDMTATVNSFDLDSIYRMPDYEWMPPQRLGWMDTPFRYVKEMHIQDSLFFEGQTYVVTRFKDRACFYYYNMRHITIPPTITELGDSCFEGCFSWVDADLRKMNVKVFPRRCFATCTQSFRQLSISSDMELGDECFYNCNLLTKVVFEEGCKTIPNGCFDDCDKLEEVILPSTMETMGANCIDFNNKTDTRLICYAKEPPTMLPTNTIFDGGLVRRYEWTTLYVPEWSVEKYKNSWHWRSWWSRIKPIDSTVTVQEISEDDSEDYVFYTISGQRLGRGKSLAAANSFKSFSGRVVIARKGGMSRAYVVK